MKYGVTVATALIILVLSWLGCSKDGHNQNPDKSDTVSSESKVEIHFSDPTWMVPAENLPADIAVQASNNNVDIIYHNGRLFMAWRTGPNHFASPHTQMIVVSSLDDGTTWELEKVIDLDTDLREPRLLSFQGELQLIFFEAGADILAFDPRHVWRTYRNALGDWGELELVVEGPEVPWDIKVRNDKAWMTSYIGEHYGEPGSGDVHVLFRSSEDGHNWEMVDGAEEVYVGGVSEVAIEFDEEGNLWAVTRNEDGDASGFGSHVCYAPAEALTQWECPSTADPHRYDSPELFRHLNEIYLIARRDIGGPFGENPDLFAYSARPKTTALYRINREARSVDHLFDLPGAGDTAFASVVQTGPDTFLVANYTSPLENPDISWLEGQIGEAGTSIYFLTLTFETAP